MSFDLAISLLSAFPLVSRNVFHCVVVLVALVLTSGCVRQAGHGATAEELAAMPDQESWNAELRISSEGRPKLFMTAAYMAHYDGSDSTYAVLGPDPLGGDSSRVRVELYDETGEPTASLSATTLTYFDLEHRFEGEGAVEAVLLRSGSARLTSDRLEYDEADGRFVANGNVVVVSQDGKTLTTDRVIWDDEAKQLRAEGAFTFTTASERISGVGLVASEDLARYSFSRASGQLEVDE